ncbi:glycosyltransferase family 4 protein [Mycolicibacterium fluoranthenivorans]|uniref:Glycosyltransferase involved in cell wall bisynthesis n=1 Tax=Mycolicibacterium fluoranthenivorans TaxID=258505 RepID=A0A1G4VJK5_9MYCO|nr:glycosyltransferase family 1 protein [Mycolicibacterium fluoranthenivorans]SCX07017.1 Glycosyltransferase involved in cell wall bisynthesis [Mycolicibacterium fluoranthenivorans]
MVRAIATTGRFELIIHVPANAPAAAVPSTGDAGVDIRRARFSGAIFEQIYLPAVTMGRPLLNFAGSAPLLKRRQLVTMHDATPFRCPRGFSKTFVIRHYLTYWWLGRVAEGLATVSLYSAHELSDVLHIDVDRFIVAGGSADSLTGVRPERPDQVPDDDYYLVVDTAAQHENVCVAVQSMTGSGRGVLAVGMLGAPRAPVPPERAVFAGHLTDAELVWLYRHSQGLVLPAAYEGFGLSALEAQALGCPVVCSDAGVLPDVCHDGALYFDPDEPDTLLAQLDRLETEIGLAEDLRRQGYENARRHSWTDAAQQIVDWVGAAWTARPRR